MERDGGSSESVHSDEDIVMAPVHSQPEAEPAPAKQDRSPADLLEAMRGYKVTPHALWVQDLQYFVDVPDRSVKKRFCHRQPTKEFHVLKDINLVFNPGTLTAIMGPSGAGKTSLLNSIAGRTEAGRITGTYLVDGKPLDKSFSKYAAYVQQDDVLHWFLTPRETLETTARLRLPATMSDEDKMERVRTLLEELGLDGCQDTIVGEPGVSKGLSGGEKKRLNIAMELITSPSILFVDEPTSGLDSHTAEEMMLLLKKLASDGVTVVTTIHQPSSEIYAEFDRLVLLAKGRIMYSGLACDARTYFDQQGYECPRFTNPADFMLTLGSGRGQYGECVEELTTAWSAGKYDRQDQMLGRDLAASIVQSQDVQDLLSKEGKDPPPGQWAAFFILIRRAWLTFLRGPELLRQNVVQAVCSAIMLGLIFLRVGDDTDQQSVSDRNGVIIILLMNTGFSSAFGVVGSFGQQKSIFLREYQARYYGVLPYFFARALVVVPSIVCITFIYSLITYWLTGLRSEASAFFIFYLILTVISIACNFMGLAVSAVAPDVTTALAVAPVVIIPQVMFSGFFLNDDSTPAYFIWLKFITPFKYAFDGLVLNQYDITQNYTCTEEEANSVGECPVPDAAAVRERFNVEDKSIAFSLFITAVLGVAIAFLGALLLWRGAYKRRKAARDARKAMVNSMDGHFESRRGSRLDAEVIHDQSTVETDSFE